MMRSELIRKGGYRQTFRARLSTMQDVCLTYDLTDKCSLQHGLSRYSEQVNGTIHSHSGPKTHARHTFPVE